MKDADIKALLDEADAAIGRPPVRENLAAVVLARGRRRRVVRRAIALAALGLAAIPVIRMASVQKAPAPPVVIAPPGVQGAMPGPLAALVAQKTADDILLGRRQERAMRDVPADPVVELRIELDDTAAFLIAAGDAISRDPGGGPEAAEDYLEVEQCFPGTAWARTAAQRMRQLHS